MKVLDEIREYFASTKREIRKIENILQKFPAFVIRIDREYGVAIPFDEVKNVYEKFANAQLYSKEICVNRITKKYLILSCII